MTRKKLSAAMGAISIAALALVCLGIGRAQGTEDDPPQVLVVPIREWPAPTANSIPHDVAVAPDGALWWTGQYGNSLGRLDPETGILREFPLKTNDSEPRGLAIDHDGNVWYAANNAGLIGKLDPRTGDITEYKMPDPGASDPLALAFDQEGTLWFTVEAGNFVGRLDPRTGKIDLKKLPTEDALPYGLAITSKGIPVFCEFGVNRVGKVDPRTMAVTEVELPGAGTRPRRIAVGKDDSVYFTDYAEGHLGRLDPKTGAVRMWASPGGPESNPYGLAVMPDGMVWYSEAGVLPRNTIVRFDPRAETFASAVIPSGGGIVRSLAAAPEGRIYIACSALNTVGVVFASRARLR